MHGWQANRKRTCAPPVVLGLCPKLKNPPLCGGIFISKLSQPLGHCEELKQIIGKLCAKRDLLHGSLFAYLDAKVAFRRWYAGHLHLSMAFDPRHVIVYDTLLTLS